MDTSNSYAVVGLTGSACASDAMSLLADPFTSDVVVRMGCSVQRADIPRDDDDDSATSEELSEGDSKQYNSSIVSQL
jgi:hypothetical protein